MKKTIALALISAHTLTSGVHAATWDIASNFAVSNTPNGSWQYGYYALYPMLGSDVPAGTQQFIPMTIPSDGLSYSGYVFQDISSFSIIRFGDNPFLTVIAGFAPTTAFYAPVVRWTAPETGKYSLNANISYIGGSGNISWIAQASIRLSDQQIATASLGQNGDQLLVSNDFSIAQGQYIDFITAKGQPFVSYSATISSVPESTSFLLALSGLAIAFTHSRRKK
jgi:hypothetical protein